MTRPAGRSLFWRLGVALMAVQVVVAVGLATYSVGRFRQFHHDETVADLERLTALASDRFSAGLLDNAGAALTALVAEISARTGVRVTVIRPDGVVLADSERDPATMDDHRNRLEIDVALRRGRGSAVRFSDTLGTDMVYFARRLGEAEAPRGVLRTARPMAAVDAALGRVLRAIGLAALLSLLVTCLVIAVVSRRVTRTVARLADDAARFASGELRHRVVTPRTRELAALADALSDLAGRFGLRMSELETQRAEQRAILQSMSNGMIALDLDQRVLSVNRSARRLLGLETAEPRGRLLQELVREPELNHFVEEAIIAGTTTRDELTLQGTAERTIEAVSEPLLDAEEQRIGLVVLVDDVTQLRRLESMRSDFAANVSHELRTPITNIKGYAETMLDVGCGDEDRTRGFLEIIRRNAARLEAIIEDLLALSRLEQPGAPATIEREPVALGPLLDAVVGHFDERRRQRGIAVRREVENGLDVTGGRQLLEQAVGNLLSNALSYSGEGTTVTVAARARDDGTIEISVADEGPGIAPRHLPRLFERFYRVDQARSRELGGTGLGLAIVKHIALVHGGRVEVESTVGHGSVIRLLLPRA